MSIAAGMLPSAELIGDIVGCHQHWDQAECAGSMVRCVTVGTWCLAPGTYRQSKVGAKTCVYLLLSFLSAAATNRPIRRHRYTVQQDMENKRIF